MMKFKQNRRLTLASGSPRRKEYLERYGISFRVKTSSIDETPIPNESPSGFTKRMAESKALAVIEDNTDNEVLLSADTVVVFENQIIGKPETPEDIYPTLKTLNGNTHQVITAYKLYDAKTKANILREVITDVTFNHVADDFLLAYANSPEPLDKAGAYSIQGIGTFLVKSINGSYNNVVGLPIENVLIDLITLGVIEVSI